MEKPAPALRSGPCVRDGCVHVALAADHRYLPGLQATLASMVLASRTPDRLAFHVLADGLSAADEASVCALAARCGLRRAVDFVRPDMGPVRSAFEPYKGSHAAFLRLFLPEFFPELDWVLYADVDTLWFRDPCDLWNERDQSVSLLWSPDCPSIAEGVREYSLRFNPRFDVARYACSGVVLMNLERMRETGFVAKCKAFAAKWGTPFFVDQDILNTVCFDDAKLLDRRWDCMMPDRGAVDAVVLHCNGLGGKFDVPMRPWRPSWYVWYRFYADVVLSEPGRPAASRLRRFLFWSLGFFYPNRAVVRFVCRPFHPQRSDQLERTLFFAWLWRRAKWWRAWLHRPPAAMAARTSGL